MRTLRYDRLIFSDLDKFEEYMGTSPRIGGLCETVVGEYIGLTNETTAHAFAFIVVRTPRKAKILTCDRGQPCQSFTPLKIVNADPSQTNDHK